MNFRVEFPDAVRDMEKLVSRFQTLCQDYEQEVIDSKISGASKRTRAGFFTCSRQRAIEAVKALGDYQCCYAGGPWPRRCDCKYGGPTQKGLGTSEQTGCPELHCILHILENLTDDEWKGLL